MNDDLAILRKRQVESLTGRSYSSLRRDIAAGQFPEAVQIGPRSIGWRAADVRSWLNNLTIAKLPAPDIKGKA